MSLYRGSQRWLLLLASLALFWVTSCGGGGNGTPGSPATAGSAQDICACTPSAPASSDFRHDQKHIPLPNTPNQDINVATMLSWGTPPNPAANAPRTGRELQMFHIAHAYVWFVWLVGSDCDIHMEIADTPDSNAPRAIVETPIDSVFCPTRRSEMQALEAASVPINGAGFDLTTPLPVEVLGLAFQDFNHARGTVHVATVWEIHPAIVNVLSQ